MSVIFHVCYNSVLLVCVGVSMISVYVCVHGLRLDVSRRFVCNLSHQVFRRGSNLLGDVSIFVFL